MGRLAHLLRRHRASYARSGLRIVFLDAAFVKTSKRFNKQSEEEKIEFQQGNARKRLGRMPVEVESMGGHFQKLI